MQAGRTCAILRNGFPPAPIANTSERRGHRDRAAGRARHSTAADARLGGGDHQVDPAAIDATGPRIIPTQFLGYRIVRQLGAGGMGRPQWGSPD